MRTALALIALAATASVLPAVAASAQDPEPILGRWEGRVSEPGGVIPEYRIVVDFGLDGDERPVALVRYEDFPCAGLWTDARAVGGGRWRLRETIVDNIEGGCAVHGDVEIEPVGDELDFRWSQPGEAPSASGRLGRNY